MPRRQTRIPDFVPHPRYGSTPVRSGFTISESELRSGYWRLQNDELFPETVLPADASKQNYAIFPRTYYVDVARSCRRCARRFIFFAREQRHWFETLRFFVDADCVLCPECRRTSQTLRRRLRRYADLRAKDSLTDAELYRLVDDTRYLLEHEVLKNTTTLGTIKNLALKRIPHYRGVAALTAALDAARR